MTRNQRAKNRTTTRPSAQLGSDGSTAATMPTFMDHVRELRNRLFAVAVVFLIAASATYPFFDKIANFLLAPLGKDHQLVYLTPGGAFSFIIQVCLYVGLVFALPAIIYNVYRFIMPAMRKITIRIAVGYTIASMVLAVTGMLFAYYVSLPAALYFLTGFNLYNINPMLTIDSYFSFIMTYMIAGALLFQIPLLMLIINGASPLNPKNLMKYQGKILLISFIIAAIISPTPDALNQILLASPIVVMYQVGIISIWLKGRRRRAEARARARLVAVSAPKPAVPARAPVNPPRPTPVQAAVVNAAHSRPVLQAPSNIPKIKYSMDGIAPAGQPQHRPLLPAKPVSLQAPTPQRTLIQNRALQVPKRQSQSVDGFLLGNLERPMIRLDEARSL